MPRRARRGCRRRHHLHVTKAREPILLGEWLAPGAHLNVVGSSIAGTAEIDTPAVVKSRFFVDYRESTVNEGGEYLRALKAGAIAPDHILGEIGEVANGTQAGRQTPSISPCTSRSGSLLRIWLRRTMCSKRRARRVWARRSISRVRAMPSSVLRLPTAEDVAAARGNIRRFAVRTPLLSSRPPFRTRISF